MKSKSEKTKQKMSEAAIKRYSKYKEIRICKQCGNKFIISTINKIDLNRKFCSKNCCTIFQSGLNNPNYGNKWAEREVRFCKCGCGETFECTKKSSRKYLNKEHYCKHSAERFTGSNNPQWRGGIRINKSYKNEFRKIRGLIKERDKYTCQICGRTNCDLDIHHIDYDHNFNIIYNLITLCHSCHTKTTKGDRMYWFTTLALYQISREEVWK